MNYKPCEMCGNPITEGTRCPKCKDKDPSRLDIPPNESYPSDAQNRAIQEMYTKKHLDYKYTGGAL